MMMQRISKKIKSRMVAVFVAVTALLLTVFVIFQDVSASSHASLSTAVSDLTATQATVTSAQATVNTLESQVDSSTASMVSMFGGKLFAPSDPTKKFPSVTNIAVSNTAQVQSVLTAAVAKAVAAGSPLSPSQQAAAISAATASVQGVGGTMSLASIANAAATQISGITGGTVSSIQSGIGPLSAQNIFETNITNTLNNTLNYEELRSVVVSAVDDAIGSGVTLSDAQRAVIIPTAIANLQSLTGLVNVGNINNIVATNISGVTGGSVASIAAGIGASSIPQFTSLTGSLSALTGPLSGAADVQGLINSQLTSLTGVNSPATIAQLIDGTTMDMFANVTKVSALIDGIQGQITDALAAVTGTLSSVTMAALGGALSLTDISSITSLSSSLSGLSTNISGIVSGSLSGVVGNISSVTSSVLSNGVASIADLSSVTGSLSSAAGNFSSINGSSYLMVSDLTSITTLSGVSNIQTSLMNNIASQGNATVSGGLSFSVTPFGGLSISVTPCTCTGNYAVSFTDLTQNSPPLTLPLIYQPGVTRLYPYHKILAPGSWILGTWQPGGQCGYYVGKGCAILPTAGTMLMVGTSM